MASYWYPSCSRHFVTWPAHLVLKAILLAMVIGALVTITAVKRQTGNLSSLVLCKCPWIGAWYRDLFRSARPTSLSALELSCESGCRLKMVKFKYTKSHFRTYLFAQIFVVEQCHQDIHEFLCTNLDMERLATLLHRHVYYHKRKENWHRLWVIGELLLQLFNRLSSPIRTQIQIRICHYLLYPPWLPL